jgi:hypothetical protein
MDHLSLVNLRYRVKGANKRARYQEMAADDLITFDELRARLVELDDIRTLAERELRALRNHEELICKLEADRDTCWSRWWVLRKTPWTPLRVKNATTFTECSSWEQSSFRERYWRSAERSERNSLRVILKLHGYPFRKYKISYFNVSRPADRRRERRAL